MDGLIKERTAGEFQKLVDYSFFLNSVFDNIVYSLQKELRLPKFADWVHEKLAHAFPVDFADKIQEFALKRGVRIVRGPVVGNAKIYTSPIDAMKDGYEALVGFEMMIDEAIDVCIEDGSKPSEDFLRDILASILPNYIFQVSQFIEGLKAYDEDNIVVKFNGDFEDFIIPEFAK